MITLEQLEEVFQGWELDKVVSPYREDITMTALTLLRQRIPFDECDRIIDYVMSDNDYSTVGDRIYLCDIYTILLYITIEDAKILKDCNVILDKSISGNSLYILL
jgi:hypothetical protein